MNWRDRRSVAWASRSVLAVEAGDPGNRLQGRRWIVGIGGPVGVNEPDRPVDSGSDLHGRPAFSVASVGSPCTAGRRPLYHLPHREHDAGGETSSTSAFGSLRPATEEGPQDKPAVRHAEAEAKEHLRRGRFGHPGHSHEDAEHHVHGDHDHTERPA